MTDESALQAKLWALVELDEMIIQQQREGKQGNIQIRRKENNKTLIYIEFYKRYRHLYLKNYDILPEQCRSNQNKFCHSTKIFVP